MMSVTADSVLSASIGVQMPTILLPLLNCFTHIFVVFDFHAFVFFQFNYHLFSVSIILTFSFVLTATSLVLGLWDFYSILEVFRQSV